MISSGDRWGIPMAYGATPEALTAISAATETVATTGADQAALQNPSLAATLKEWAPVVGAYVKQLADPARQVDVLSARLANARARGASRATIRILEAKLRAAQRNAAEQSRQREQTTQVRQSATTLTRVWTAVGIGAILYMIIRSTRR